MMAQLPDYHMFDSLAVDAEANICVATLITGGITIHSPDGQQKILSVQFKTLIAPLCLDALSARVVEEAGFKRVTYPAVHCVVPMLSARRCSAPMN
jgi:hypothetical protein